MANDRQQEEIDDYVNGDITEQVEREVQRRVSALMKKKQIPNYQINYISKKIKEDLIKEGWPIEDREMELRRRLDAAIEEGNRDLTQEEVDNIRQEIRRDVLDNMEFKRRFQQERHLDDLQEQQRRLDANHYQYTDIQQHDRWWAQKGAMSTERNIYTEDIGGMHPNEIVDRYATIAQLFNISDTLTMQKILDGAQDGMISGTDFKALIGDGEGSELIESMMQRNNGNINVKELMQTVQEQRIKTAKGYMDVAKEDMAARSQGIDSKIDLLNKATTTSVQRDEAYYSTLNNSHEQGVARVVESEERVKNSIKLSDIEKATAGVPISAIEDNGRSLAKARETREVAMGKE